MRYLLWFLIIMFCVMIVYFSLISSPRLSWNAYVPNWIAYWADKEENDNFRTAIPFVFLGLVSGILIVVNRANHKWWFRSWIIHVLLVVLVELGQLLRPLRSCDIMDILWGMVGSGFGLMLVYLILRSVKSKKYG